MIPVTVALTRMFARGFRGTLEQLEGLSDEQLNRPLALPETNTLYQLATHTAGATEFWTLTMVGREPTARDRDAEFRASGSFADLQQRFGALQRSLNELLAGLSPEDLARVVEPPPALASNPLFQQSTGGESPTVIYCLLHALQHLALHVGHIQLTRQFVS